MLLTPAAVTPARAQAAQQAALSNGAKSGSDKSDSVKPAPETDKAAAGNVASVDQADPLQQKSLTDKAIDRVKQAAKSASDIFNRVPCLPPKGAPSRWDRCRMWRASWLRGSRC